MQEEVLLLHVMILAFSSESDKDKFDLIFSKYKSLMLHKAYEILKDAYLAEDAVSEAFLRIYKNIHKIADPLSNQNVAFIVTIAKNAALTIYNKSSRSKRETAEVEILENVRDERAETESIVLSSMAAEDIRLLIDGLNEKYRQVFLLKYAHDCSHREIGNILGMTEGNVTVVLHRAKKALAKSLKMEETRR